MDDAIRVFSGRTISSGDIEMIKWARKVYPKLSRSELAGTVCELIGWTNSSGRAKLQQCMQLFQVLEEKGVVELPALDARFQKKSAINRSIPDIEHEELNGEIGSFKQVQLKIASRGQELKRWRSYVNYYHMLGDKQAFGSRLHYFVKTGDTELGCIQFSASSWALAERDKWIGWSVDDRKARLHLIVNNSRFLIFPWVRIRNLASKALSVAAKQIQEDWLREYCYAPVLLETFVDLEHFKGTCYKAANWIYVGETKGRGRMDRDKEYALSRKAIFMYPLQDDFKACLKGEKPYKVVNPE